LAEFFLLLGLRKEVLGGSELLLKLLRLFAKFLGLEVQLLVLVFDYFYVVFG